MLHNQALLDTAAVEHLRLRTSAIGGCTANSLLDQTYAHQVSLPAYTGGKSIRC